MEHYWAGELVLVPEVLQRSVAKVFLTTEVPHAGFDAPLDPLCRWPFLHVLGRRAGVFLDAFPESFPHLTIYADKGTSDVLAGARLCHQSERGFASIALDTQELEFAFGEGFCLQPIGGRAAAIFAVPTPSRPAPAPTRLRMEPSLGHRLILARMNITRF